MAHPGRGKSRELPLSPEDTRIAAREKLARLRQVVAQKHPDRAECRAGRAQHPTTGGAGGRSGRGRIEPIKDAFHRLSRFGHAAKARASPVWNSARLQSEFALQWLRLRPGVVFWAGGIGIAFVLILSFVIGGGAFVVCHELCRSCPALNPRGGCLSGGRRSPIPSSLPPEFALFVRLILYYRNGPLVSFGHVAVL